MSAKLIIEKFHLNLDIKYETELTKEQWMIIPVRGIVCAKILICKDCIQVTESQQYEHNTLRGENMEKLLG